VAQLDSGFEQRQVTGEWNPVVLVLEIVGTDLRSLDQHLPIGAA
jgi:hypothetical protein